MARISQDKINQIIQLYNEIGIYSQVAKIVGCSPATVKKYCNEAQAIQKEITPFSERVCDYNEIKLPIDNLSHWARLTKQEELEIKELWKEI